MSDIPVKVGANLRAARKNKKLTQMQLADLVGTRQWQIVKYETGRQDMTVTRLFQFAAALGVEPSSLLK